MMDSLVSTDVRRVSVGLTGKGNGGMCAEVEVPQLT